MSSAMISIRAHFDGKFIVPDEPVVLPLDAPLDVKVQTVLNGSAEVLGIMAAEANATSAARRLASFEEFTVRIGKRVPSTSLPAEALRRENMYGDEGR